MEHDDHDILLGMDWCTLSGALLNPSQDEITFLSNTISCFNTNVISHHERPEIAEEGRLPEMFNDDFSYDNIGIDPKDKISNENVKIETKIKLYGENLKEWLQVEKLILTLCTTSIFNLGKYTGEAMSIHLTDNIPVFRVYGRRPKVEQDELEDYVNDLHKAGIVEPSSSGYNNPPMLLKKKNGKKRVVHDFRWVNIKMETFTFPIPLVSEIIDNLSGFNIFSVLDMSNGFWQVPIEESCRKFTSFSTSRNHWQYCAHKE